MGKYGFMDIPVPKEYGGQGCDPLTYVMCVEELSKVCGTTGVIVTAGYITLYRSYYDIRYRGAEEKICS